MIRPIALAAFVSLGLLRPAHGLSFDPPVTAAAGITQWWARVLQDVDRDGMLDFFVTDDNANSGWLAWYETGSGGVSWTRHQIAAKSPAGTSFAGGSIDAADIDNDGAVDVLGLSHPGEWANEAATTRIYWYKNPGGDATGTWQATPIGSFPSFVKEVKLADFNRDGKVDVVLGGFRSGDFRVYRQNSPSSWTLVQDFKIANLHEGMDICDIDGDGDTDVAANGYWVENPGGDLTGDWKVRSIDSKWHNQSGDWRRNATKVSCRDINRDGRAEVFISHSENTGYPISWYEAPDPVKGGWTEHVIATGLNHVHTSQVFDMDNDGDFDLVTGENAGQESGSPQLVVFLNGGDNLTWTPHVVNRQGTYNSLVGDLEGDGDMDIWWLAAHDATSFKVIPNATGKLSLSSWRRYVVDAARPWQAVFITAEDLTGDGRKEIMTGGWWYRNAGSDLSTWTRNPFGAPLNNMACVFDFDGDGDADVLGTQGQGADANDNFAWAQNNGSGGFSIHTNVPQGDGDFLQGVAADRFSAGGPLQVALSWHQAGRGIQMLNVPADPAGTAWTWARLTTDSQDEQLSAGDIDRDGDLDLLMGTQWLENDGASWPTRTFGGGMPDRNRLADINGDGRLDAVVGYEAISKTGKLAWYEAPADPASGVWTEHVIANIIGPMSLDVGDLDGDGDIDVVAGEHNLSNPAAAKLYVFENTDGRGTAWTAHTIHTGDEHHDGAQLVDIDNDGDLDIISIGWSHGNVLLYENLAITSGPPTPAIDAVPPRIGTVLASGGDTIIMVYFDEPLDAATAGDAGNYAVDNGVTLLRAAHMAGGRTVILTTGAPLSEGVDYTLTVKGVADTAGNSIAANTQARFRYSKLLFPGGAVAYWSLNEGSGTTAEDPVGGHIGTLSGARFGTGIIGGGVDFAGGSNRVDLGSFDVTGGSGLSIALWFKASDFSVSDARLISKAVGIAEQDHDWMLSTMDNGGPKLRVRLKTGGTTQTLVAGSGGLTAGEWTLAVATYDGANVKLYKDKSLVGSQPQSGAVGTSGAPVWLGNNPPDASRGFSGSIDEVRLYNRALAEKEIEQLFNQRATLRTGSDVSVPRPDFSFAPDPYNSSIRIRLRGVDTRARISIFDTGGRIMTRLHAEARVLSVGWHAGGSPFGVYLVVLETGHRSLTRRIILSK